jgi:hypothetical protein
MNNKGQIHGKYTSYERSHMDEKFMKELGYMKEKKPMVI